MDDNWTNDGTVSLGEVDCATMTITMQVNYNDLGEEYYLTGSIDGSKAMTPGSYTGSWSGAWAGEKA